MLLLMLFAFIAGIVTILSPCILPILPIVLSGSVTGGRRKPLGIVAGFVASFTFFTLFLSAIVRTLHVSPDALRTFSIVVIFLFGLSLLIPKVQEYIEIFFAKISGKFSVQSQSDGFMSGVLVGLSLGLLWTPCVGPILASVITLALTGTVTTTAFFITLAYSLGTALPMLAITYSGRSLFQKIPWLLSNTKKIQMGFGVIMMITAMGLMFNIDRKFQVWVLTTFPSYGTGLTKFEEIDIINDQLEKLNPSKDPQSQKKMMGKPSFALLEDLGKAPEIIPGGVWFNLPEGKTSLSMQELRGKVVLVDFWTYSCINCIRTLPYLKDWHDKYADKGLVIIGVHSPEFEFEKSAKNVQQALYDFEITYPIVQDNNFDTWKAYDGNSWPRKYLVDKEGVIRNFHSGEGAYEETEEAIQLLLEEAGASTEGIKLKEQDYSIDSKTRETYLGFERTFGLASPEQLLPHKAIMFTHPTALGPNEFSYSGEWLISEQYAAPSAGAEVEFNYESKDIFLVMKPKKEGMTGKVKIYVDGRLVENSTSNPDVIDGVVTIDADRLYTLMKFATPGRHTIKLIFQDSNVEAFAFTFG